MSQDAGRNRDLGRIHAGKKQLGLDDDAYRDLLRGVTGKASAADLDARERWRVILALEQLGAKPGPGKGPAPAPDQARALAKVQAMLEADGKPMAYGQAMAKNMFGKPSLDACDADQLRRIVAALNYHAKRTAKKA